MHLKRTETICTGTELQKEEHCMVGLALVQVKKISSNSDDSVSLEASAGPEEALSESLSNSFGAGSYARRMLENMGWKEGEALGCSNKGLIEPLQATGNKGSAGLGWNDERRKQSMYSYKKREM